MYDPLEHYKLNVGPTTEFGAVNETEPRIRNIGWTLGNDCPYRCTHCYSMNAREKGKNLSIEMIDRIVDQLKSIGVETVNLGGNEPLFTNGPNPRDTLLPYIISELHKSGIEVGLTTSGISAIWLYRNYRKEFELLNDCDVSFDSPFEAEHNKNRGANIYRQAVEALQACQDIDIPRTCIMAAMSWNFSITHIDELVLLAKRWNATVRINPLKPVQPEHFKVILSPEQYYRGFKRLHELCTPIELGEPPLAAVVGLRGASRCPCGRSSFRIHSITPTGQVHVSPCVYLHDYKSEADLLTNDLADIINSAQFRVFRQRNAAPELVKGCSGCSHLASCGGGCAARAYLHHFHETGEKSFLAKDPYCPVSSGSESFAFVPVTQIFRDVRLVHMDYLCTWIGRPI
jgi:radical SAM protein with 4Fe4S-binding SPASM domain